MKRTAPALVVITLTLALAACTGTTPDGATTASPSPSPSSEAETAPAPVETSDVGYPILPASDDPVSGRPATVGPLTVTIPLAFSESDYASEGARFYDGEPIPASASPDGTSSTAAGIQLYDPYTDPEWAGTIASAGWEGATEELYTVQIEGADRAALRFASRDEGSTYEADGVTIWDGPVANAELDIQVGDQVVRVVITTSPGDDGLDFVRSFIGGISVA